MNNISRRLFALLHAKDKSLLTSEDGSDPASLEEGQNGLSGPVALLEDSSITSSAASAERSQRDKGIALIAASALFDRKLYLENNADVADAGVDPVEHFYDYGSTEGRRPNSWFDPAYYMHNHPDLSSEAFCHYLEAGRYKGYAPSLDWRQAFSRKRVEILGLWRWRPLRPAVLSIGLVTYNTPKRELSRCLNSLFTAIKQLPPHIAARILILDNGEASSLDAVKGDVERVPSAGNIGFGAGHNLIMERVFGTLKPDDLYIAVNPDGAMEPSALAALVMMAQSTCGQAIVEGLQFPVEHPKYYHPAEFETSWASGACMLIPLSVYRSIGGFDEAFFMYCEDVDYSWRARAAGFSIKVCPRALFYHSVVDRKPDRTVVSRQMAAAITLAQRWGNTKFEEVMREEAKRLNIECQGSTVEQHVEATRSGIVDFDHDLYFSPVRWS